MAKLSGDKLLLALEREKARQEKLKKKMEIQKKKEELGENWKKNAIDKLKVELQFETGQEEAPKLFNSVDLNEFFQPIKFYQNEFGDIKQEDFQKYIDIEKKFEDEIDKLNKEIQQNSDKVFEKHGTISGSQIKQRNLDVEKEDKNKIIKARNESNLIVSKYFNRFVPIYDKHVCSCCGKPKKLEEYFKTYSLICSDRVDTNGEYHMNICRDCSYKLFMWIFNEKADKDLQTATKLICAYLNLYWDAKIFKTARDLHEKNERTRPFLAEYISLMNRMEPGKTFFDSPFLDKKFKVSDFKESKAQEEYAPQEWDKEDIRNEKQIIRMVGYNPFEWETNENKRILYKDLLNILEPGMENDLVKFQAAIQIVMSFFRVRQLNKKQFEMEKQGASVTELKQLSDLKDKELKSITAFSRDNGFAERYATAKAKGENTFTGIMNRMNEDKFEKAILNRYDIETSATIQQAADASFKAIFNQLGMTESEIWKTSQEQFEELRKLRKKNSDLEEELRKARYELAEINLEEKARIANMDKDDMEDY